MVFQLIVPVPLMQPMRLWVNTHHEFTMLHIHDKFTHFADNISKKMFEFRFKFHKNCSQGPIDNIPSLFHIMAWCGTGNKLLYETMMAYVSDVFMRHSAPLSQNTYKPCAYGVHCIRLSHTKFPEMFGAVWKFMEWTKISFKLQV